MIVCFVCNRKNVRHVFVCVCACKHCKLLFVQKMSKIFCWTWNAYMTTTTQGSSKVHTKYSQTWANDYLRIATTCKQRPPFCGPILNFYNINDLWTTTTCQQRPLFVGPEGGLCTQVWLYITLEYKKLFKIRSL